MSEFISENEENKTVHSQKCENEKTTFSSGRLRDEKGHFLPSDAGKCKHDKKQVSENNEDKNVVKIKIVKDKKPKVPRNIIGKLNEMKERNASRFIESVISNSPTRMEIDGKMYYSSKFVNGLMEEIEKAQKNEADAIECMEEMKNSTETLIDEAGKLVKKLADISFKHKLWRSLSVGLLIGFILGFSIKMAQVYIAEIEKNTQSSGLITSEVR